MLFDISITWIDIIYFEHFSPQAECIKTGLGTHTCICQPGWSGDGRDCSAINNCLLPNRGGCHDNATCMYVGPGQVSYVLTFLYCLALILCCPSLLPICSIQQLLPLPFMYHPPYTLHTQNYLSSCVPNNYPPLHSKPCLKCSSENNVNIEIPHWKIPDKL